MNEKTSLFLGDEVFVCRVEWVELAEFIKLSCIMSMYDIFDSASASEVWIRVKGGDFVDTGVGNSVSVAYISGKEL